MMLGMVLGVMCFQGECVYNTQDVHNGMRVMSLLQ
jgi:hypothetical protein